MWGVSDSWLEHTGKVVNDVGIALKYHVTVDCYVPPFLLLLKLQFVLCLQEHTVLLITKLLSLIVPADYSGVESHLRAYPLFLDVLLVGISSSDCIQIFNLHGMVG